MRMIIKNSKRNLRSINMRLDQLIDKIDRLSKMEKFALINRLAYQLDIKGMWLSEEEILEKKMRRKREKKKELGVR